MNIDTRINNDFFSHPKTVKLQAVLGEIAPMFLIKLWLYASKFFSDGVIKGLSPELLEKQIGWTASNGKNFIETLENIGFIEREGDNIVLHDWDEHNQYASTDNRRKDLNRFNSLGRYFPEVARILRANNVYSITASQYKEIKASVEPEKAVFDIFKLNQGEKPDPENMQSHMQSHVGIASEPKIPQYPYTKTNTNIKEREREGKTEKSDMNVLDDMPSSEFLQLRAYYDQKLRPEGSTAGWEEFKKLRKSTGMIMGAGYFPGIYALMDDIDKRIDGGFWEKGYEPSLAKYLKDRTWQQPVTHGRKPQNAKSEPKSFAQIEDEYEAKKKERLMKRLQAIAEGEN